VKAGTQDFEYPFPLRSPPDEDVIWRKDMAPHLTGIAQNVVRIRQGGFTEMVNHAIEHSGFQTFNMNKSKPECGKYTVYRY
jgi:hypothetical protein